MVEIELDEEEELEDKRNKDKKEWLPLKGMTICVTSNCEDPELSKSEISEILEKHGATVKVFFQLYY